MRRVAGRGCRRSGRAVPRGGTAGDEPLAEWRALAAHSRTHMRQWPGARGGRVASRTDDRRGVAAFRARTRWFRSCCVQKKEAHRDLTPAAAAMTQLDATGLLSPADYVPCEASTFCRDSPAGHLPPAPKDRKSTRLN